MAQTSNTDLNSLDGLTDGNQSFPLGITAVGILLSDGRIIPNAGPSQNNGGGNKGNKISVTSNTRTVRGGSND